MKRKSKAIRKPKTNYHKASEIEETHDYKVKNLWNVQVKAAVIFCLQFAWKNVNQIYKNKPGTQNWGCADRQTAFSHQSQTYKYIYLMHDDKHQNSESTTGDIHIRWQWAST